MWNNSSAIISIFTAAKEFIFLTLLIQNGSIPYSNYVERFIVGGDIPSMMMLMMMMASFDRDFIGIK